MNQQIHSQRESQNRVSEFPVEQVLIAHAGSFSIQGAQLYYLPVAAAAAPSISEISLALSLSSAARITPSACLALRAPTIAPVTAGWRSVQAMATSPGERPCRAPTVRSLSTSSRFFESFGSRNSGLRLRKSSAGKAAARSRVIAPVSKPEAIGA